MQASNPLQTGTLKVKPLLVSDSANIVTLTCLVYIFSDMGG